SARGAAVGAVVCALSVGSLAATAGLDGVAGLVTAGLAYLAMFGGLSVTGLLSLEMQHNAVSAAERTTVTSTSSLSLQGGGVVANSTLGVLATQAGPAAAWWAASGVVLVSALLFVAMPKVRSEAPVEIGA
ncbi:MAG: MFS transporter, partial [Nonomuraea sp.]|nr:MFS transporter [Nonomuraea sp.]